MSIINIDEGAAFGAALLAGVGAGVYADVVTACRHTIRVRDTLAPRAESALVYDKYYRLYRRLYADLRHGFVELAELA
jgi:xylulokinase